MKFGHSDNSSVENHFYPLEATELTRARESSPFTFANCCIYIMHNSQIVQAVIRASYIFFCQTNVIFRLCREISFKFRTKLPHGLLVYHSVKDRPEGLDPYALYVIVEKGQLKVVHVFGKRSTSLTVGEGLNRDEWHSVLVRIDVHGAKLIARVDDKQEETTLEVLESVVNYGVSEELASVVLIGGSKPSSC